MVPTSLIQFLMLQMNGTSFFRSLGDALGVFACDLVTLIFILFNALLESDRRTCHCRKKNQQKQRKKYFLHYSPIDGYFARLSSRPFNRRDVYVIDTPPNIYYNRMRKINILLDN
jgi:hypothetical protein